MPDLVAVGDTVRIAPRGVEWVVLGVRPSEPDPIVLLVNQSGTQRRQVLGRFLFVGGRRLGPEAWSAPSDPTGETLRPRDIAGYRQRPDGSVVLHGRQVRDPDRYVQVVTEWRWPTYTPGHPDKWDDGQHPRAVSATVCSADVDGERWLELRIEGALDTQGGISMRREAVLALGYALLGTAADLGDGYTPGR